MPPFRTGIVPRARLIERLNEGLVKGRKLTLISAPAGFGKTTLARLIAQRTRYRRLVKSFFEKDYREGNHDRAADWLALLPAERDARYIGNRESLLASITIRMQAGNKP